jgi:hypothetical protein
MPALGHRPRLEGRGRRRCLGRLVDARRYAGAVPGLEDFDRYVEEHGVPEEDYPAAFALWIAQKTGGPVPRFVKVERKEPEDGVVNRGRRL